jgi:hypothetical protein
MIPTLEATTRELMTNDYLSTIIHMIKVEDNVRCPCRDVDVAALVEINVGMSERIRRMSSVQKLEIVPYLCRLGYSVAVIQNGDCPFEVQSPGHAATPKERRTDYVLTHTYYYATSPGMLRLRGFFYHVWRLLAWLKRSREHYWACPYGCGYLLLNAQYRPVMLKRPREA